MMGDIMGLYPLITTIMENQMEKKMENEMETTIYIYVYIGLCRVSGFKI